MPDKTRHLIHFILITVISSVAMALTGCTMVVPTEPLQESAVTGEPTAMTTLVTATMQMETPPIKASTGDDQQLQTPTSSPTPKPEDNTPKVAAANTAVNLRTGPGLNYARVGVLPQGKSLKIVGRNVSSSWWQVDTDDGPQWVSGAVTTAVNAGDDIPVITDIPEPVATATPIPGPEPALQSSSFSSTGPPAQISHSLAYGIQADPDGDPSFNIPHIRTLGLSWIKIQMPWKEAQPSPSDFRWAHWDQLIDAYHQAGLNILLSIPKAPDWARPADDDKSVEGPPSDPQAYADFLALVSTRYAGRVQAIEVWNEQNLYYEAGGQGRVNADTYMELLKAAYRTVKAVNPNMIVVSGALTPTGAPPPLAVDDVFYLRQMYERGLKDVSDAIGAHPSGFANPPEVLYPGGDYDPTRGYDDHRSFFFRNTMEDYRRVMLEFGDDQKAIWPTEFGWPVWRYWGDARFEFAQDNTLEEQGHYIWRAYEMARDWGWVGPMFLWNLDYAITHPTSEMANFGIMTKDGVTPAYEALRDLPKAAP